MVSMDSATALRCEQLSKFYKGFKKWDVLDADQVRWIIIEDWSLEALFALLQRVQGDTTNQKTRIEAIDGHIRVFGRCRIKEVTDNFVRLV